MATQEPLATLDLVHNLLPVILGAHDQDEQRSDRAAFIRSVLDGWIASLGAPNHEPNSVINNLLLFVPRISAFIAVQPRIVLTLPSAASISNVPPSTLPANKPPLAVDSTDLGTFLFSRILNACLQLSLDLIADKNNQLTSDLRKQLIHELENLLGVTIIGLGSARVYESAPPASSDKTLARELVKIAQVILQQEEYPYFIESFAPPSSMVHSKSPEARMFIPIQNECYGFSILLSIFRILFTITVDSPFLHDLYPTTVDLFYQFVPMIRPGTSKLYSTIVEYFTESSFRQILECTKKTTMVYGYSALPSLALLCKDELQKQLLLAEIGLDEMELDQPPTIIGSLLAQIYSRFYALTDSANAFIAPSLSATIIENQDRLIDTLISPESPVTLRTCVVYLLASRLYTIENDAILIGMNSLSKTTFITLNNIIHESGNLPFQLPPSLTELESSLGLAWEAFKEFTSQTQGLKGLANLTAPSRKRRRDATQTQVPTSDTLEDPSASLNTSKRRRNWKGCIKSILEFYDIQMDVTHEKIEKLMQKLVRTSLGEETVKSFRVLGLLACAKSGSMLTSPQSTPKNFLASCTVCDNALRLPPKLLRQSSHSGSDLTFLEYCKLFGQVNQDALVPFLKTFIRLFRHSQNLWRHSQAQDILDRVCQLTLHQLSGQSRALRLAAGNAIVLMINQQCTPTRHEEILASLKAHLQHSSPPVVETTLITVGRLGGSSHLQSVLEGQCLKELVTRLIHPNLLIKGTARLQIEDMTQTRKITPYALLQPHFSFIAPVLVSQKNTTAMLAAAVECFHTNSHTLLRLTREHTLPELILRNDVQLIKQIATASRMGIPQMLLEPSVAAAILSSLYIQAEEEARLSGIDNFIQLVKPGATGALGLSNIISTVKFGLVYRLILYLSDPDENVVNQAEKAFAHIEEVLFHNQKAKSLKETVCDVIKESMVGILGSMTQDLSESGSRRPLHDKQRILRGLKCLIERLGGSILTYSYQVMAALQSALEVPGLRLVSLEGFKMFLESIKYREITPYIAGISASYVKLWQQFDQTERTIAATTLLNIVLQNPNNTQEYLSEVADLGEIPELSKAQAVLVKARAKWTFAERIQHILSRVDSENDNVILQALVELRAFLLEYWPERLVGKAFDSPTGTLMKSLLAIAGREGVEYHKIRNVAYECIGIIGALDPDRLEFPPTEAPFIVHQNFRDADESAMFCLHLIQELLVPAYRATNDIKHQSALAYTIQELLLFCGITSQALQAKAGKKFNVDPLVAKRCNSLPKHVLETCAPLFSGSGAYTFSKSSTLEQAYECSIYSVTTSYREWIRTWAMHLMQQLQNSDEAQDAASRRIFLSFYPIFHLEDITVIQHVLPHLVLYTIISGEESDRKKVKQEIEAVLTDQVLPTREFSENNRHLIAQTVFQLMDHLSRWITYARKIQVEHLEQKKRSKTKIVPPEKTAWLKFWETSLYSLDTVLGTIPTTLVAEAAFKCKSYARALMNFESHIISSRDTQNPDSLQTFYERLHECYANLDDPDGMEGVSTLITSPSLQTQILEHEVTGRWTSAQSCWEVLLQQKPNEPANHLGLLACLRNLGHFDSMKTHIEGLSHSQGESNEWSRVLAPYKIQASLFVGDWEAVQQVLSISDIEGPEIVFGRVIDAIRCSDSVRLSQALYEGRESLGTQIMARGNDNYQRIYDTIINLHILHELSSIQQAQAKPNIQPLLAARLESLSPAFRARDPVLNMRRSALLFFSSNTSAYDVANLWLETSKSARKAGYDQTSYSAILRARDCGAKADTSNFVFLQEAKLLKANGQIYKAIRCIDGPLQRLIPPSFQISSSKASPRSMQKDLEEFPDIVKCGPPSPLAKSALRRARWMEETSRLEPEQIMAKYREVSRLAPDWESPHFYLGHFRDQMLESKRHPLQNIKSGALTTELVARGEICQEFSKCLQLGTKFIYQALPRMLTLWLETGEEDSVVEFLKTKKTDNNKRLPRGSVLDAYNAFKKINHILHKSVERLSTYMWMTVLPNLVSRILHPNYELTPVLEEILLRLLRDYSHQTFWAMASAARSQATKRARKTIKILSKCKEESSDEIKQLMDEGIKLVDLLLKLCNHPLSSADNISMGTLFPDLKALAPTKIIIPLQSSLTVSLPVSVNTRAQHKPFPSNLPIFQKFEDQIQVMNSLQKPRKVSVEGDDGITYSFLCKPKDDLRKDARLMEFNSMIIKLLKKDSEARKRKLTIRTYSVVPLNEECGLIEWVPHVVVLRGVLTRLYSRRNIQSWTPELKRIFETIRDVPDTIAKRFENEVISKFPPVFHEWLMETFSEPSEWHRARLAYSRTTAVISMVGFVLGLGDRHCENILLDATTGDAVHVDFNCLFDRARGFDVPERVPFRLTNNIIDGMGVSGIEGVFRHCAEISMRILRHNQDSLMSVLETFLHDPLVEWNSRRHRDNIENQLAHIRQKAKENLGPISNKLRGLQVTSDPATKEDKEVSVQEQVERLIREARNPKNLGAMYVGWCAYF